MKNKLTLVLAVCLPVLAHAQAYKCKQADGAVTFQSQPCPANAVASKVDVTPANGSVAKPTAPPPGTARTATRANPYPYATADDIERLKAQNAELQAWIASAKAADPNWRRNPSVARIIEQADALDARIKADTAALPRR